MTTPLKFHRLAGVPALMLALAVALLAVLPVTAQAFTRAEKRARAQHLTTLTLPAFIRIANSNHTGIDATLDWSNDGCSAPFVAITGTWSTRFHRSCRRHDFGYRNFGKNYAKGLALISTEDQKRAVDRQMYRDMTFQCQGENACELARNAFYNSVDKSGKSWTAFYDGECWDGYLCVFDDDGYGDRRKMLSSSEDDFNDIDFGDKTSSVKNRSKVAWRLYDDDGFRDRSVCVPAGGSISNLDTRDFGDKTSAAKRLSGASC